MYFLEIFLLTIMVNLGSIILLIARGIHALMIDGRRIIVRVLRIFVVTSAANADVDSVSQRDTGRKRSGLFCYGCSCARGISGHLN